MGQRQDCGTGVIYTHVAAAVLAGGIAFAGGWKVHAWKTGSEQAADIEAAAESARLKGSALLQSTARTDRETTARLRTAEAAALDARSDLERLRNETDAIAAAAHSSASGCADSAGLERVSGLLSEGSGLVEEGAKRVERLAAEKAGLQQDAADLRAVLLQSQTLK